MVKSFVCHRCGHCCMGESTVSLTETEIENLSAFLEMTKEEVLTRFLHQKKGRTEMKVEDGYCIFFDRDEKICRIHPVKPAPCKVWPLHPSILADYDTFLTIKDSCIGLKDFDYYEICKIIREVYEA